VDSAPSFVVQIPDLSSSERRDRIHQRAGSTLDPLWSKRQQECLPVEFPRLAANVFKIALVASGMPMATMREHEWGNQLPPLGREAHRARNR